MARLQQHRKQRDQRRSGHVMVEGATILIPFLALFFALFDFSMAIFLKNTMQFAVRQGVRYAITSQVQQDSGGNNLGHDASIKNVVSQYAFGFLNYVAPTGTGRTCSGQGCIVIQYFRSQTNATTGQPELVEVTGTNSNAGGNVVQVSANNLTYAWMVPLLRTSSPLQFSVSSADVMEPSPGGGIPAR